ncbi:unnamed protein product, partial [Ixodes pacificus]
FPSPYFSSCSPLPVLVASVWDTALAATASVATALVDMAGTASVVLAASGTALGVTTRRHLVAGPLQPCDEDTGGGTTEDSTSRPDVLCGRHHDVGEPQRHEPNHGTGSESPPDRRAHAVRLSWLPEPPTAAPPATRSDFPRVDHSRQRWPNPRHTALP